MDAQETWKAKIEKLTSVLPCSNSQCGMREYEVSTKIGSVLSDFKASLREAIEKEIRMSMDAVQRSQHYEYLLRRMTDLIDSTLPKNI